MKRRDRVAVFLLSSISLHPSSFTLNPPPHPVEEAAALGEGGGGDALFEAHGELRYTQGRGALGVGQGERRALADRLGDLVVVEHVAGVEDADAEELAGALTDELAALFDEEPPGISRRVQYA